MVNTKAAEASIIKGNNYRISILTDRLIRFEYSKKIYLLMKRRRLLQTESSRKQNLMF